MIFRFICTRSGRACMHQGVLLAALSGGAADAPFRGGPDFREAQGTRSRRRRARHPGRLSFPPFLWRDKEKGSGAGRSPAQNPARAQVLPQDLSHQEINAQLGLDNAYTRQVEAFLRDISR